MNPETTTLSTCFSASTLIDPGVDTDAVNAEKPRVAIARYDDFFNMRTFSQELRKTAKSARRASKKNPVVIVRRIIDSRGNHTNTLTDIMSERLRGFLRKLHKGFVDISEVAPSVELKLLYHSSTGLQDRLAEERRCTNPDQDFIFELETVLNLISEDWEATKVDSDRLTSLGRITFDMLWTLFPPGCAVYRLHPQLKKHQVMRFIHGRYTKDRKMRPIFLAKFDIVTNDGDSFGYATIWSVINHFPSTVRVEDLEFFPLQHHSDRECIRSHTLARGQRFSMLCNQLFVTDGIAFEETRNRIEETEEKELRRFHAHGRVMIDPNAFAIFEPDNDIRLCVSEAISKEAMTDEQYAICSPVVVGFCFGTKKWGGFALENLVDIEWEANAFDSLVLEPDRKAVVQALIQQHSARKASFDDVIAGKGKGLVGLLYGNPGCGKTLTAEAVAEVTRRPLYVIGAGDLGTTASEVDTQLHRIFALATWWDTLVLIDEADVFLHKRSATAVERNALVAVFLRHLEYFKGVLILTTNMNSETLDPAFESRIHFCIRYPDLPHQSRKIIWKGFLNRELDSDARITEEEYDRLASIPLNGRQIKNTVSVSIALASDRKVPLAVHHIELVLNTKAHWENAKITSPRVWGARVVTSLSVVQVSIAFTLLLVAVVLVSPLRGVPWEKTQQLRNGMTSINLD